jgi:hypothetical protein
MENLILVLIALVSSVGLGWSLGRYELKKNIFVSLKNINSEDENKLLYPYPCRRTTPAGLRNGNAIVR